MRSPPNHGVALERAGMTVFRDTTFLAAGPASESSRSATITCSLIGTTSPTW